MAPDYFGEGDPVEVGDLTIVTPTLSPRQGGGLQLTGMGRGRPPRGVGDRGTRGTLKMLTTPRIKVSTCSSLMYGVLAPLVDITKYSST
jgi:hypothetical protein